MKKPTQRLLTRHLLPTSMVAASCFAGWFALAGPPQEARQTLPEKSQQESNLTVVDGISGTQNKALSKEQIAKLPRVQRQTIWLTERQPKSIRHNVQKKGASFVVSGGRLGTISPDADNPLPDLISHLAGMEAHTMASTNWQYELAEVQNYDDGSRRYIVDQIINDTPEGTARVTVAADGSIERTVTDLYEPSQVPKFRVRRKEAHKQAKILLSRLTNEPNITYAKPKKHERLPTIRKIYDQPQEGGDFDLHPMWIVNLRVTAPDSIAFTYPIKIDGVTGEAVNSNANQNALDCTTIELNGWVFEL